MFVLVGCLWDFATYPTDQEFPYSSHLAVYAICSFTVLLVYVARWRVRRRRIRWRLLAACVAVPILAAVPLYLAQRGITAGLHPRMGPAASAAFLDATVAMEDGRFYEHGAFDWISLHRALRVDVRHRRILQGGSTITQQLAKNLLGDKSRTLWRKAREAFLALALERTFTKRQILALYVDRIDYGMGQAGIKAAAAHYCGKDPSQLTLAESAVLVSLVPSNPQALPSVAWLEDGRQRALSRIAYWFPGRYSGGEVQAARTVSLNLLMARVWPALAPTPRRPVVDAPPSSR